VKPPTGAAEIEHLGSHEGVLLDLAPEMGDLVGHYREVGRRSILSSPAAIRDGESVAPLL
jgi:hypothetical protein